MQFNHDTMTHPKIIKKYGIACTSPLYSHENPTIPLLFLGQIPHLCQVYRVYVSCLKVPYIYIPSGKFKKKRLKITMLKQWLFNRTFCGPRLSHSKLLVIAVEYHHKRFNATSPESQLPTAYLT